MKLNIDIKPKEWMQLAAFVLLVYLLVAGKVEDAIKMIIHWLGK
jgi:hypothetical protein